MKILFKKHRLILSIILLLLMPIILISSADKKTFLTKEYMIGEISSEEFKGINYNTKEFLLRLPYKVLNLLYRENVKIIIVDSIGEEGEYGIVASKYIHDNKEILMQDIYIDEAILYHEIGHAYSYNKIPIFRVSYLRKFKDIYKNEKEDIFPSGKYIEYDNFRVNNEYIKSDVEEYYAQCFSMYFTDMLSKETKTFDYYEENFNSN